MPRVIERRALFGLLFVFTAVACTGHALAQQTAPSVIVIRPPGDQLVAGEAGQSAGEGLRLDPLGRGQLAGGHRPAPVEVAKDAELQQALPVLGSFQPEPPGQLMSAAAHGRS